MKKFTILMAIFIFMANCAMAQDTIPEYSSISIDVTPSYHRYGSQYGCFRLQADFSKYVSNKWAVGAGMLLEGFNDNEFISKADVSLPLNYLHVSTNKFGFFVTASYSTSFGIFMAEAWFGDIGTYISASDDRCRIKVETENGSYITNDYNLSRTDGKEWATNKNGSLALSYMIPWGEYFRFKFSLEYEFLPRIRKSLVDETVEITSSNWDEFETYYGQPVVNLYEASEDVRRICSISQFNVGIGFCFHIH